MSMPESPFRDAVFTQPDGFSQPNGVYCRYCGATPAVDVDFRAHRGLIFMMQFRKLPGPFCRECGLAVFRKMTGDSLVQGWWGLMSMVINPFTILMNVGARYQVAKLPPPVPGAPRQPMSPGRPLLQRWQIAGVLVPLAVAGLIIAGAASGNSSSSSNSGYKPYVPPTIPSIPSFPSVQSMPSFPSAPAAPVVPGNPTTSATPTTPVNFPDSDKVKPGDCVWDTKGDVKTDTHPKMEIVSCGDDRSQATVLGKTSGPTAESQCDTSFPDSDLVYTHSYSYGGGPEIVDYALCMQTK
ncbi:hypothetical protein [Nocardia sp. NPDC020380]|uniref:LppU/SCO3897 family protein n=1 Tax=Nocardia sp. NPDC020380 TaxID=3364309 RepID=UPI0037ABE3AD